MPECLDSFPWRSLKGCGDMAKAMFKVGDYKNDVLKDGTPVQFRIIGFDHDITRAGTTAPVTWQMVDCMPSKYPWNRSDTNEGSWERSYLRHLMNDLDGDVFGLMPDEIVELATPVIKLTANTHDGSNFIIETEDRFWIKSEKETFGRSIFSAPGEGRWYEWYRQEDVPWGKKRGGSDEYTMLRSPIYNGSISFCYVCTNGLAYGTNARSSRGLAPAFCF
mgnify:CR=1 FL=1